MATILTHDQKVTDAINACGPDTTARFQSSRAAANRSTAQLRRYGWTVDGVEEVQGGTRVEGGDVITRIPGFIVRAHRG